MRVRLKHETRYTYRRPAALGPHVIRLRPATHAQAQLLSYNLEVDADCEQRWQFDPWGNRIVRATFDKDNLLSELGICVDAAFDVRPVNPFDFFIDDRCEDLPFGYPDGLKNELAPFLEPPLPKGPLADFIETVPFAGRTMDYLVALNQAVAARVGYIIRNEPGIQTSNETLERGQGSCRDSALLLCDVLRSRGLAARFVSGYLIQLADEGIIPDETKGVAQDVVDLHAWAEVYVPGAGWIGVDGTSGLLCGEGHIPLATAVAPEVAAPISGTASQESVSFDVTMSVERLGHEPRPRKPYDDAVWDNIVRSGAHVDDMLAREGLRLTSGGEPTWTSRLHPAEPEWITEAVGPTKWEQGLNFAERLSRQLGGGTFAMHRFGKLYPGESLPRWALELFWRVDGKPIWRDRELLNFQSPADRETTKPRTDDVPKKLVEELAERLSVEPNLIPGYEDPWHFIQREQGLPPDVDPLEADLEDEEERRRLARVLSHGLGNPIGYVMPIQYWNARWLSAEWSFRRERLYLVPGDSPMGLRLPLDQLAGEPFEVPSADTTAAQDPLRFDPEQPQKRRARAGDVASQQTVEQVLGEGKTTHTALCVENRDGVYYAFVPPLPTAEAFLELVCAIEESAKSVGVPVRVEGYKPPPDPRIRSCLITPDPGVIEVNLPVAEGCAEYLSLLETISDAANHAGLCAEKYQLDGRQVGSGGGNHLTLGGPTPAESPFVVRPDLLASLLRFIQNHPSLSYVFTGLFVGPTSQAPRVDEARTDSLHELELALSQVPKPGDAVFPWEIDRLLRNLLVDVTGNTHRTEVCIDKLYAAEGPTGRLGIVELRAFEMPPNERMAAVQMLLARALIGSFAKTPYTQPLVPWGTALHDKFMLPYYLEQDLSDVARHLRDSGIDVDIEWFRPFLDYRMPVFGTLRLDDIEVELRSAIEPWPTLGEQPAGPVVARYVDSSLERIQVRAVGLDPERYKLAVNGIELPMTRTATVGETVAGVRFRAWQPPFCLQPNIGVHHPLRFDVVDTWGKRSLGACQYHVWHPQGRGYDTPPLTAFEAAARRAQRFSIEGHAPWPVTLASLPPHPEHPLTLDLRWASVRHGQGN